ncbi:MAG: thiamine pyrophosphate-dependent enzyme [Pseudomonadota bacterium]
MKRKDCFEYLATVFPADIVIPTYSSAFEWLVARPHPLNYVSVGAMGLASSHALGLALAMPNRRIVVLDGDGSLLMNLGTLVSVGACCPRNFLHFVSRNGTYEANGGHPLPGGEKVDFPALALAAGYTSAVRVDSIDALALQVPGLLSTSGPVLIELSFQEGDTAPKADYEFIHGSEARRIFACALHSLIEKI